MSARDRIVIVALLVAGALAGFWFLALSPKREKAASVTAQVDVAKQQLAQQEQSMTQARQAKARYDADYAEVASLGKAVPKNDALPSLVYQLQSAARDARIEFNALKIAGTGPQSGAAASGSAAKPAAAAPATQAATASLPPGASVGSAGFPTMPFSFVFNGSFPDMESFLRDVQNFVRIKGDRVDVRGRLLSVDGFSLSAGPKGFPSVRATITATAYLLPAGDETATGSSGSTSPDATSATTPGATTAQVTQ